MARQVTSSGGSPVSWQLVERGGQVVLDVGGSAAAAGRICTSIRCARAAAAEHRVTRALA